MSGPLSAGRGAGDPSAPARGDVWLGDLIQAWRSLKVNDEEARQVAELIGFSPRAATVSRGGEARGPGRGSPPAVPVAPAGPGLATARGPATSPTPRPAPVPAGTPEPAQPLTFRRHLRPAGVEVGLRAQSGADTPGSADLLAPRPARRAEPLPLLPLLPLLPAMVAPGILTASIATDAGDGTPDVDALVELVAQRRFEEAIPHLVRASLFRGVQLLLDRSPAMTPFARDVTELAQAVRSVVGHNVEEISFSGHPQNRFPPGGDSYAPPRPGTPVLALTDLGIAHAPGYLRPDAPTAWSPLGEMLLRRGSQLVALVPYPPERWPALGGSIRMIPWDTTTSPADVTRAVGRILGGPRGRH